MCRQCEIAERKPNSWLYSASCDGCKARAIANGTELWEASREGHITPRYRAALERVFGERWKQGHEQVKRWASRREGVK
jgi:hypothetical protein